MLFPGQLISDTLLQTKIAGNRVSLSNTIVQLQQIQAKMRPRASRIYRLAQKNHSKSAGPAHVFGLYDQHDHLFYTDLRACHSEVSIANPIASRAPQSLANGNWRSVGRLQLVYFLVRKLNDLRYSRSRRSTQGPVVPRNCQSPDLG